jgi:hypothetical protein
MLELFRQCDIYVFHFILGYAKLQLLKWNTTEWIKICDLFQPHLKYTFKFFQTFT